jgi:hypothetical protein
MQNAEDQADHENSSSFSYGSGDSEQDDSFPFDSDDNIFQL